MFPDANELHEIVIRVTPPSGYWSHGTFVFDICVPLEYNIMVCTAVVLRLVSKAHCLIVQLILIAEMNFYTPVVCCMLTSEQIKFMVKFAHIHMYNKCMLIHLSCCKCSQW